MASEASRLSPCPLEQCLRLRASTRTLCVVGVEKRGPECLWTRCSRCPGW